MKLKREMKIHKTVSPAKINLNLKVINFDELLKKHRLSSRIAIVKLHDEIEIYHSWGSDGSPIKPVTYLNGDLELGRYSVWTNPKEYAKDIHSELEKYYDYDEDDELLFLS